MSNLLNLIGVSIFATVSLVSVGCLKKASNSAIDSAASTEPVIDPASGKKVFKVDPATGGTLSATGISSNDPNFSKATIVIPPGALSIPVDVSLFESTPIVNAATQAALGVSGAIPAGPAVAIVPSADVTISGSFQISIPYSTGLNLNQNPRYVVFGIYSKGDKFEVETFVGNELTFDPSGVIKISIKRFGAFQVAKVESDITKSTAETEAGFSSQKEAETSGSLRYTTFYITTPSELPKCDHTRISHLYYVLKEKEFRVCDGSKWAVVELMPTPVTPVSDLFANPPQSTEITVSNQKRTRTTTTYSTFPGGPAVRVCYTDLWAVLTQDKNGSIVETKNGGDNLCSVGGSKLIVCKQGYKPEGEGCVADKSNLDNSNLIEQFSGEEPYLIDNIMGMRLTYKYFASHEPNAELVRTCFRDSWQTPVENGISYFSKNSGDPGCGIGGSRGTSCNNGFGLKDGACVPVCSAIHRNLCDTVAKCQDGMLNDPKNEATSGATPTESNSSAMYWRSFYPGYWNQETSQCQSSCENGKIPTTRGCELPVICDLEKVRTWDNTCINIAWTEKQPGDLAGPIKSPTLLKSGVHTVKGDVSFEKQVKFEPGVILEFEGDFEISTLSTVYAIGTERQKIILRGKESPTAEDPKARQTWRGFNFNSSDYDYTLTGVYRSGSKFAYVDIFNSSCGSTSYYSKNSSLYGFAENLLVICQNHNQGPTIQLRGYIKNSNFQTQYLNTWGQENQKSNIWEKVNVTGNLTTSAHNAMIIGSWFSGSLSVGEKSVVAFSTAKDVSFIPDSAVFVGNRLSGDGYYSPSLPPQRGNEVSHNSTTEISDATAVIVMPEGISGTTQSSMLVGQVNQPFRVSALIADKNGWISDATVNWVTYQTNAPSEPVAGNPVTLTLGAAGIYGVSVQSISSQGVKKTQFIGRPIITTRIDAAPSN